MLDVVLGTSDWLRAQPDGVRTGEIAPDERLGTIAVLTASLEHAPELTPPQRGLADGLRAELDALPPQFGSLAAEDPVGEWLLLAAVAEDLGAAGLAHIILGRLLGFLTPSKGVSARDMNDEQRERLGMCWARRGRLSRIAGKLDDAEECYRHAARLASRKPWRDAYPQALVGLSLLALNRGNLPEGERHARAILRHRPHAHAMYGLQAHQMLAYTSRRRGKPLDALLHAWSAFDLLDRDDFRRDELLLLMAEIAAEFGDLKAAASGFASVRVARVRARIRIPALAGALDVAIRLFAAHPSGESRAALAAHLHTLDMVRQEPLAPNDRLIALLAVVEGALALNDVRLAAERLSEAGEVAREHGFFEKQFRVDALHEELRARENTARRPADSRATKAPRMFAQRAVAQSESSAFQHPALQRLRRMALAHTSSAD
jgi:hypothetical protein